jgi:hypothetical protein
MDIISFSHDNIPNAMWAGIGEQPNIRVCIFWHINFIILFSRLQIMCIDKEQELDIS